MDCSSLLPGRDPKGLRERGGFVAMLQMDKMVETILPEGLESIEIRQLYNIKLLGRIE